MFLKVGVVSIQQTTPHTMKHYKLKIIDITYLISFKSLLIHLTKKK